MLFRINIQHQLAHNRARRRGDAAERKKEREDGGMEAVLREEADYLKTD